MNLKWTKHDHGAQDVSYTEAAGRFKILRNPASWIGRPLFPWSLYDHDRFVANNSRLLKDVQAVAQQIVDSSPASL